MGDVERDNSSLTEAPVNEENLLSIREDAEKCGP